MNNFIQDQLLLYRKYRFPEPPAPRPMDESLTAMRFNFLLEELRETATAAGYKLVYEDKLIETVAECKKLKCERLSNCDNIDPEKGCLGTPCQAYKSFFKPVKERPVPDGEKILDGLVDLAVVLFGTAFLYGFLETRPRQHVPAETIFEEAWGRVYQANAAKVVGVKPGRDHALDLVKPAGWKPPKFTDLVTALGFYGYCKDCAGVLTRDDRIGNNLKCAACRAASEPEDDNAN